MCYLHGDAQSVGLDKDFSGIADKKGVHRYSSEKEYTWAYPGYGWRDPSNTGSVSMSVRDSTMCCVVVLYFLK